MKHKSKLLLLLFPFFLNTACKKDELKLLPDATQSGADTMGAIVNGKAWVANGGTGFNAPDPVEGGYHGTYTFDSTQNNVLIDAYRKDKTGFQIYLRGVFKPGEYPLNSTTNLFGGELKQPQNYGAYYVPGKLYMTTSKYKGMVIVTKADTINGIVSGTFAFKAVHGQDSVVVTNGRFDVSTF
ncbi:DUF6252 family protein [Pontibacter actiniarum]|uniref:Uncharacterized protein n=1 Tax=Pontibacter actiniarum TaxID=323450 RepID=A0A1X9YYY0_9BACT|nr:DUF6252 family protein [Pontibacter actiniarum]ARS38012.1 hypothetical protein CA264_20890 [Pontibacter actiniarum]